MRIVNSVKNVHSENNPLRNLNNKSFCDFLDHFHFPDGYSLITPVCAAMIFSSDIDWNQLSKFLEAENGFKIKFGSSRLLDIKEDEFIQGVSHLMESIVSLKPRVIANKSELYLTLYCIRAGSEEFAKENYVFSKEVFSEALFVSLRSLDESSSNKIPMIMRQVQNFFLPNEVQYKAVKPIVKLMSHLAKIPNGYQSLTSTVIDIARRVSFAIVCDECIMDLRSRIANFRIIKKIFKQKKAQLPKFKHF